MCQARPSLPAVYIMKDHSIVLHSATEDMDLHPSELFGFGIGDFLLQEVSQDVDRENDFPFMSQTT